MAVDNNFRITVMGTQGLPGPPGSPGEGVVEGGTTGQVLAKKSSADYDTEWVTQNSGIVESIVAGENITVDNADPENPVISSSGGGGSVAPEPLEIIFVEPGGLAITGSPRALGLVHSGEGPGERVVTLPQATSDDVGKVWTISNFQADDETTVEITMGPGQTETTVIPRSHTLLAKVIDGTDMGHPGMYAPMQMGFYPRMLPNGNNPVYWAPSGWKLTADILDDVATPAPSTGTYSLKSVDGVITWVEDV